MALVLSLHSWARAQQSGERTRQTGPAPSGQAPSGASTSRPASPKPEPQPTAPAAVEAGPEAEGRRQADAQARAERSARLRERARKLRALAAGTLDPAVSLEGLFTLDLQDPAFGRRDALAELASAATGPVPAAPAADKRGKRSEPKPLDVTALTPEQDLRAALAAFLRLPVERRAALIAEHRARAEALQAARTREGRARERLESLEQRNARLRAFLNGNLDPSVDPAPLLSLPLGDVTSPGLHGRLSRLSALASQVSSDDSPPPQAATAQPAIDAQSTETAPDAGVAESPGAGASPPTLEAQLEAAEGELDRLLVRFASLAPEAQQALFQHHANRGEQAVQAAAAPPAREQEALEAASRAAEAAEVAAEKREQALEAARAARSRSLRLLEQERARLHAIEEAQARHEESLEKERARLGADREEALAWNERVAAVGDKGFFERPKPQDAERLHRRIGGVLDVMHDRLSRVLQSLIVGPERGVPLGERLDEELLHEEHRGQLDALWSSVAHKDEALRAMESRLLWERASELRDAIVALNRARLQALGLSGRAYRSEVTGFGPRGVQEARRELQQVALELRYHVLELPRHLRHLQDDLSRSPFALVWSAIHLLIVLALFRMWRQHADRALTRMRRAAREGVAQTATTRLLASSAWYLRRIHRPLDWLVLLWIVLGMAGELAALPEVGFVRLVLIWVLGGSLVVLLLDAVAARQNQRSLRTAEHAALRLRSLRLLGLTVVVLGLLLNLTEASLGQGTIYAWTWVLCFVLAAPLWLLLVYWWRSIIFERLQARAEDDPFARVLAARSEGLLAVPAAMAGGAYLLFAGLLRWVRDELYDIELTRRVLAYLVRTQVARHSRAAGARSGRPASQLSETQARFFRPGAKIGKVIDYASDELTAVARMVGEDSSTLTAVVGERGRGKTAFLERLCERLGERAVKVTCPRGEPGELLSVLAAELELGDRAGVEQVAEALRAARVLVVCVDDVQHLVRPTIDGLERLDEVEELARRCGGVSWVLAIDSPAWAFVERAFGDRVAFDGVIKLPRWTETQLGELIRARTEQAGLDPEFDDLTARRQLADLDEGDEERLEQSFYRIIWDSSDGNAAVALRSWRDSLWRTEDGRIWVRMFDEPSTAMVDTSPLSVLFVLRSILQMDVADRDDLVEATNLTPGEVHNALRFAEARGFVEEVGEGAVRVTWPWYRAVTRVLSRKRLLVI
jgi:hypothetical protein